MKKVLLVLGALAISTVSQAADVISCTVITDRANPATFASTAMDNSGRLILSSIRNAELQSFTQRTGIAFEAVADRKDVSPSTVLEIKDFRTGFAAASSGRLNPRDRFGNSFGLELKTVRGAHIAVVDCSLK